METKLDYCESCTNRSFNPSKGLVCGLTMEKPQFLNTCPDYLKDLAAAERLEFRKSVEELEHEKSEVGGLHQYGIKSPLAAGIILIVVSVVWLVGGIVAADRIFFYPIIMFFFGIYRLIIGIRKMNKGKSKDLLDQ